MNINLLDGKYSVEHNNGKLSIWRYKERWEAKEQDMIGDGFVLSLVQKIEDLLDIIDKAESCLVCSAIADPSEICDNTLKIIQGVKK